MSNQNHQPKQRELWLFNPDPVTGNELGKKPRPALIISNNTFNRGPAEIVIIVPCTTKNKGIPSHIRIDPPNGGLKESSFIVCEQLRSISKERLIKRYACIDLSTFKKILEWIADFIRVER